MNTETKELANMDSEFFEQLDPEKKEEFEQLPETLQELAKEELGDQDKTTVKDPTSPLFWWAEMRQMNKKMDRLEAKIDRIFGNHSLVDGEWVDTSNFAGGS